MVILLSLYALYISKRLVDKYWRLFTQLLSPLSMISRCFKRLKLQLGIFCCTRRPTHCHISPVSWVLTVWSMLITEHVFVIWREIYGSTFSYKSVRTPKCSAKKWWIFPTFNFLWTPNSFSSSLRNVYRVAEHSWTFLRTNYKQSSISNTEIFPHFFFISFTRQQHKTSDFCS